jgi:hypothetical protein
MASYVYRQVQVASTRDHGTRADKTLGSAAAPLWAMTNSTSFTRKPAPPARRRRLSAHLRCFAPS